MSEELLKCLSCKKDVAEKDAITGSQDDDVDVVYCSVNCRDSYEQGLGDYLADLEMDRIAEEKAEAQQEHAVDDRILEEKEKP